MDSMRLWRLDSSPEALVFHFFHSVSAVYLNRYCDFQFKNKFYENKDYKNFIIKRI